MRAYIDAILFAFAIVFALFSFTGCASLQRLDDKLPVKEACVFFDPPIKDSDGDLCDLLCVRINPPAAVWRCQSPPAKQESM